MKKEKQVKAIFGRIIFTDDTAEILNNVFESFYPISKAEEMAEQTAEFNKLDYIIPELYEGKMI